MLCRCWSEKWRNSCGGTWQGDGFTSFTGFDWWSGLWLRHIYILINSCCFNPMLHCVWNDNFSRLVLVRQKRRRGTYLFVFTCTLMIRSLFLEHFLQRSSLRYVMTWCSIRNLCYHTTGNMVVSTLVDTKLLVQQGNILFNGSVYICKLLDFLLQYIFSAFNYYWFIVHLFAVSLTALLSGDHLWLFWWVLEHVLHWRLLCFYFIFTP